MFQNMSLAQPNIEEVGNIEMEVLEPVMAHWIESDLQVPLHEVSSCVQVQIIDIDFEIEIESDIIVNKCFVKISDGLHFLTAKLDCNLNTLVTNGLIDVYDIIEVKNSTGHPARFSVELVRLKRKFLSNIMYNCLYF